MQSAVPASEKEVPEQEKAPAPAPEAPQMPNPMVAVLERHERLSNRLKQNGVK